MVYQGGHGALWRKTTTKVPGPLVVAEPEGWPGPRRKASQHSTFFGKIAIFAECCDGFYCLVARSKCRRPNSSNAAGTAVTTMPAPTSVCCTPNVAARHGAIASGATPANMLPKPMTEFTRPSCSRGAVVCTIVLWSGLRHPRQRPGQSGRQGLRPRTVSPHRANFPGLRT